MRANPGAPPPTNPAWASAPVDPGGARRADNRLQKAIDHCCLMSFNILMVGGVIPVTAVVVGSVALVCCSAALTGLWVRDALKAVLFSDCGEMFSDWSDSFSEDLTTSKEKMDDVFTVYKDIMQPCVLVKLDKFVRGVVYVVWVVAGFLSFVVGPSVSLCLLPFVLIARAVRKIKAGCED